MHALFIIILLAAQAADAAPQDAERFTHFAGLNLAELPTFEEVAKRFGPAPIVQTGDAASFDARVCYRTADEKAVIEFFHGEVDWGFVFRLATRADKVCPKAADIRISQLDVAGVKLQMGKQPFKAITGLPHKETTTRIETEFQYQHVLTDAELGAEVERGIKNGYPPSNAEEWRNWDVIISLTALFAHGRLYSFTVDRVETN